MMRGNKGGLKARKTEGSFLLPFDHVQCGGVVCYQNNRKTPIIVGEGGNNQRRIAPVPRKIRLERQIRLQHQGAGISLICLHAVGRAQHPQRFHERQHHVGCREELGGIAWYIGTRRRWPVVVLIVGTAVQLLRPPLVKYLSKQSTRRNVTRPHELVHTIGLSSR